MTIFYHITLEQKTKVPSLAVQQTVLNKQLCTKQSPQQTQDVESMLV